VYARSWKEREAEEEMGLKARWLSLGSELAAATPRAIPSLSRDVPSTINGQWTMVHGCACLITEQKQKRLVATVASRVSALLPQRRPVVRRPLYCLLGLSLAPSARTSWPLSASSILMPPSPV
jgi:hypothetical protein